MLETPTLEIPKTIALDEILSAGRKLSAYDKLTLIRMLVDDLRKEELLAPLNQNRTIELWTPYNSFGVAEILAEELAKHSKESAELPTPEGEHHALPILDPQFVSERN